MKKEKAISKEFDKIEKQNSSKVEKNKENLSIPEVNYQENFFHNFKYEDLFPKARSHKRKIKLIIGPTNSGKTYEAIKALINSNSGAYLGPLRLLALEKFEEISKNKLCSLITGEEKRIVENSQFTAQTIETFNTDNFNETVIVDEIQLISDSQRGIAYTKALFGAWCDNLILVGSPIVETLILKICERLGEEVEIIRKERLSPLLSGRVIKSFSEIKDKTAIIVFDRRSVFSFKETLEHSGFSVATVYGALSPEVRIAEAKRFESGEAQVLIATDAIGMGLNLTIEEIVFSKTQKFDGISERSLIASEVKQIAGRAGRFGRHEAGYFSSFSKVELDFLNKIIKHGEKPPSYAYVFPTFNQVESIINDFNKKTLFEAIKFFENNFSDNLLQFPRYGEMKEMALFLNKYKNKIPIKLLYDSLWFPVNFKESLSIEVFDNQLKRIASNKKISNPFQNKKQSIPSMYLFDLEVLGKVVVLLKSMGSKFGFEIKVEDQLNQLSIEINKNILKKLDN